MLRKTVGAITAVMCLVLNSAALAVNAASTVDTSAAKSAVIIESVSGTSIVESEADAKAEVAGLTRLAPLLMVCEAVDVGTMSMDTVITVSEEAARVKGPTAFIEPYEKISVDILLKAAIMISAGDAIYALSEAVYGSDSAFLQKLNARLGELSVNAAYDDIIGTGVTLSANELAIIARELGRSKAFLSYSGLFYDSILHEDSRETELANPNKLVRYLSGCTGIATGSSEAAGYCGVFAVTRGDTSYICVTLGSKNSSERFSLATELIEYAFASFRSVKIAEKGDKIAEQITVRAGTRRAVDLVAKESCVLLLPNGANYEPLPNIPEELAAPLSMDQTLGKIEYRDSNGNTVGVLELTAAENIEEATFWDNVFIIFLNWLHA